MRDVYPLLTSIGKKYYSIYREEFSDLAMDLNDVIQELYIYYLDFQKKHEKDFDEKIIWSAIKTYVTWNIKRKISNWKKRKVSLISLDTEISKEEENENGYKESKINNILLRSKNLSINKTSPFTDANLLMKTILKVNPKFNSKYIEKLLGKKKFKNFMEVLERKETYKEIAKRRGVSKQYVDQEFRESLKKVQNRFLQK